MIFESMQSTRHPRMECRTAPDFVDFTNTKVINSIKTAASVSPGTSSNRDSDLLLKCKAEKFESTDSEWIDNMTECPVYYPTKEEFEDPFVYLRSIAADASKYGICKIVSPLSSSVPAGIVLKKETTDFKFTTKVQPLRLPGKNSKNKVKFYMRGRHYTVRDFEKMANNVFARKYSVSGCLPPKYVETEFWREMTRGKKGTVEYGADLDASAFSCDPHDQLGRSKWNLKTFPWLPNSVLRLLEAGIPGVTDPMLYIGMLFSMFAWHVEDHYLYSISYLHCGAPKTWYGVPSHAASDFEKAVQDYVYASDIVSSDGKGESLRVLLERTTMFPPSILMQHDIPVYKAVQQPGEFVINFPRSYHSGFNQGFNCSEAVNFASGDWFPFGAAASQRYSLLNKMPILPYEELLCKEAMHLWKYSDDGNNFHADSISAYYVKISFTPLMRMYQCARWALKKLGALLHVSYDSQGTVFCTLCKRGCYVAHFTCNCHRNPLCLFHDIECYSCLHQSKCTLFIRSDALEMENVGKGFEQEEGIRDVIKQRIKCEIERWMPNEISGVANEYIPYNEDVNRPNKLALEERSGRKISVNESKTMLMPLEKCCKNKSAKGSPSFTKGRKRARSRRGRCQAGKRKASKPVSVVSLRA